MIQNKGKIKRRTKMIFFVVLVFFVVMFFSYRNLEEKSRVLTKQEHKIERQIDSAKEEKLQLEKKKKYINSKEFIEKTAREKFGLFYPSEFILKSVNE